MEIPVVDFHTHAGRWGTYAVDDDPETFLRIMDAAGVDRACINCIFYGDASRGNDTVARLVDRYPDRFIGVAFVTPHYPEEAIPELERAFDELGMKFLKVYPDYFGRPIDDPGYFPIFEWCDENRIVIMSHSSLGGFEGDTLTRPSKFIPLAKRYPQIRWVLAHSGNREIGNHEAINAAQECPNIYLETATSMANHGTIERLVDGAGEDRVLYGSDTNLLDMRLMVGRIVTAEISSEAKLKVLGLNAINLLGLDI